MSNVLDILQDYYEMLMDFVTTYLQPDSLTGLIVRIIIFTIAFVIGLVILGFTGILQNPI
jgi:hypothetical protein